MFWRQLGKPSVAVVEAVLLQFQSQVLRAVGRTVFPRQLRMLSGAALEAILGIVLKAVLTQISKAVFLS